jgi:hypothetical protein
MGILLRLNLMVEEHHDELILSHDPGWIREPRTAQCPKKDKGQHNKEPLC